MSFKEFEEWFVSHEEECVKKYKEVGGYEGTKKFFGEFCEELYAHFMRWKASNPEKNWRYFYAE